MPRALDDWQAVLDAMCRHDHAWLARRFDPWIKYDLFSAFLKDRNAAWPKSPDDRELFRELALLDHRVLPAVAPIDDDTLFRDCSTRAVARAGFLREHDGSGTLRMDWCHITDAAGGRVWRFDVPFSQQDSRWRP